MSEKPCALLGSCFPVMISGTVQENNKDSINVSDVPQFDSDELHKFSKPVVVKAGQNATFKMTFPPQDSLEIKWFKDGSKLMDGGGVKVVKETNNSRLQIKDCLQSDAGEIKIQLKNLSGTAEAISRLIVLGKIAFQDKYDILYK